MRAEQQGRQEEIREIGLRTISFPSGPHLVEPNRWRQRKKEKKNDYQADCAIEAMLPWQ